MDCAKNVVTPTISEKKQFVSLVTFPLSRDRSNHLFFHFGQSLPTFFPTVPAVVSHCNITITYDHPPDRLLFIKTTWDSMPVSHARTGCHVPRFQFQFFFHSFSLTESLGSRLMMM